MHVKDIFLATVDQPRRTPLLGADLFNRSMFDNMNAANIHIEDKLTVYGPHWGDHITAKEKERLERIIGIRPAWWKFW